MTDPESIITALHKMVDSLAPLLEGAAPPLKVTLEMTGDDRLAMVKFEEPEPLNAWDGFAIARLREMADQLKPIFREAVEAGEYPVMSSDFTVPDGRTITLLCGVVDDTDRPGTLED